MSAAELVLMLLAVALLAGNAAALFMWRRARTQRDDAIDAVDTLAVNAERVIANMGEDLATVSRSRDRAVRRAERAEARERIAQDGWGRAVDKLLAPAPLTITMPEQDRQSLAAVMASSGRAPLWAVPRG